MSQLRRGAAEYGVLALLCSGARYGGEVARLLCGERGLVASAGTVYPLLARLEREGAIESWLEASPLGPDRRYYALTARGKSALLEFKRQWLSFRQAVDNVLEGVSE